MLTENDKKQIEQFISMLYHDDHDSNYFICHFKNGKMNPFRTSLDEFDMSQIKENDCYISLNGFAAHHRKKRECRQINGIVFDLDYHYPTTPETLEWIKQRNLKYLLDAIDNHLLYEPNIITNTSRGYQFIYLFNNSIAYYCKDSTINEKAIYAYNQIRITIEKQMRDALPDEDYLDIDQNVYDIPRIVRLPGTTNTKTGQKTYLVHINEDYYDFTDFYTKKEKKTPKQNTKPKQSAGHKKCSGIELQKARIEELEKLQQLRGEKCEGYRNYMTFIYYNSAVQIYDKDTAVTKTLEFCNKFPTGTEPFSNAQIKAIIRNIDKNKTKAYKGHYVITKEWIFDKLAITDIEAKQIGITNNFNSRAKKKQQNQLKKAERNDKIITMTKEGIKHSDIAKQLGISLRTVQTVLKINGLTRDYGTNVNVQNNAA